MQHPEYQYLNVLKDILENKQSLQLTDHEHDTIKTIQTRTQQRINEIICGSCPSTLPDNTRNKPVRQSIGNNLQVVCSTNQGVLK